METLTATPAVEETVVTTNVTAAEVVKGLYESEDTVARGRQIVREGNKSLATFIALTPVLYEAIVQGETVSGLLGLAGFQHTNKKAANYRDDQQFRYYVLTGEVLSRLGKDKTKPVDVNTAVNRIADKQYPKFTKRECDDLITRLVEANGTWADFVKAVESYGKDKETVKDQASVDHIVANIGRFTPGMIAQLKLALQDK